MQLKSKIGVILRLLLNSVLFFLSYMVPKDRKLILLSSSRGITFRGNPKYFFLELLTGDYDFNPVWITKDKTIYQSLKRKSLPVVYAYSISGCLKILRSQYLIIDDIAKDILFSHVIMGRFNIIQTTHGILFKKIGMDIFFDERSTGKKSDSSLLESVNRRLFIRDYKCYKLIIATSETDGQFRYQAYQNPRIEIVGFPRNDIFFQKSRYASGKINTFSPPEEYQTIIVYAPTFRDEVMGIKAFSKKNLQKLNEHLVKTRSLFMIKRHPLDTSLSLPGKYSNISDDYFDIDDIQELLVNTDILVTDYSSVFFDFMLTDKPVIFFPYDIEGYLKLCRGLYISYFEDLPGPFAKNENELIHLIKTKDLWFSTEIYQDTYKNFKDKFHKYQDGRSGERLARYLFESLNK